MFEFQYTSECLNWEGKLHRHTSKAYFATRKVFLDLLNQWSGGGAYQYWESPVDYGMNSLAKPLSSDYHFRMFSVLHFSTSTHMNEFVCDRNSSGVAVTVGCCQ